MANNSKIELFLKIGLLIFVFLNLTGCLSSSSSVVMAVPIAAETPDPSLFAVFPEAEGFGTMTVGGRGGDVIEVTNLDDSGPGSLRAAIKAAGNRIIIFRVAGTIELESSLVIENPYITIAGQTSPGQGITLRGIKPEVEALILIKTHDVVIRFLALRAGPPSAGDGMMILTSAAHDTYNIVIDHNSFSWAVNRNLATWYDVHDITIQWNIFSEGLNCSIHPKGCHSKGVLLGGYASDENKDKPGAGNISFHHNLLAHNGERNPLISTSGVTDVVNNVAYNPFGSFSHVDMQNQLTVIPVNYVGNIFKAGVDTDAGKYGVDIASKKILGAHIYVLGNIDQHRTADTQAEIDMVDPDARPFVVSVRNPAVAITTSSVFEAYDQVLAGAGANMGLSCDGTFFSRRDAIDTRIVNDVLTGTGKIIDDPSDVGGWLVMASATPCTDADHDGMPDVWEENNGFNPADSLDGSKDADEDGYTNVEEFLNGTDPNH
jgi:pectate lyase